MKPVYRVLLGVLLAIGGLAPVEPVLAQGPPLVCRETCPDPLQNAGAAAVCTARVELCSRKLDLYKTYMGQLALGVTLHRLPQVYIDILQPLYIGSLNNYRFGFGDRQPPNNATTDCTVTYFNHSGFVDKLRNGNLDTRDEFMWLFHEMRHFSQCQQLGSRDAFARGWFANLEVAFLQSADLATIHDRMPMEAEAEGFATNIRSRTAINLDAQGHLVKPIALTLNAGGTPIGDTLTANAGTAIQVAAVITGGSDPMLMDWGVKPPGEATFQPSTIRGRSFSLAVPQAGTYQLMAVARQENSGLAPARKVITVNAAIPRQIAPGALTRDAVTDAATSMLQAQVNRPLTVIVSSAAGRPLQAAICIGDGADADRYGRGNADQAGRVTLNVLRGLQARVTVTMPGYIATTTTVAMPDAPQSLPVTLRPGLGGPTCG